MWPEGSKIHFVHSHVAYQIKGNEDFNTVVQKCRPGACLGVTRGQKIGFCPPPPPPFYFIVKLLLLGFLSWNIETVTGNSPMDEDWRNTFGIFMCREIRDRTGAGICDGAPSTCSSCLLFLHAPPCVITLRKHAYSNILKILPPKNGNFSDKKNLIFFIFLLKTYRLWVLVRTASARRF